MTDIKELRDLIERVTGIVVPEREMGRLGSVAERRAVASGQGSLMRYLRYLADGGDTDEWRALLGFITVNESYLFRGPQQLAALTSTVIPRLMAVRPSGRLTIWSAGCARGEEAATLAIVLAETLGWENVGWRIVATDLDENSLAEARQGRYGSRAVEKVSPELLSRYFTRTGNRFELASRLRQRISYSPLNLVSDSIRLNEAPFDIVFLRNVLIYFRPVAQRRVVESVAATLAPDGVVFVGPSESLWQLRSRLQPEDLGDCFCYRLGERPEPSGVRGSWWEASTEPEAGSPETHERPSVEGQSVDSGSGVGDLPDRDQVAIAVAAHIRLGEAEAAVATVTEACRRLPGDPVLRAIEGRILELTDETERAVAAYRAALYLEPSLCEARFLLAECLHRLGRHQRAGRELRSVLASLASKTCTPVSAMDPLGRPSRAHMEWRAREILDWRG